MIRVPPRLYQKVGATLLLFCGSLAYASGPVIAPETLTREISARMNRVQEFRVVKEACIELKMRCWLFGGTAAGYGHFVKWDLQREAGDARFLKERFESYDFTDIYRSTQDADLVADGTVEQIEKLEGLIKSKLSYFQGSKDDWEVRSLRFDRGDKQSLLDNPDFLNQHTDSNSTGMIELTDPPRGESAVRDLRDWKNQKANAFLRDVTEGKIHYYFSGDLHKKTTFYKQGRNPEIFSVIRYLTKAFQYDLEIRAEDRPVIERIIREFSASRMLKEDYAKNWIEKHAKKLVLHAVNIEYALSTLEELGLKQKLIKIRNDATTEKSLAWWLSREALPTRNAKGQARRPKNARTLSDIAKDLNIPPEELVVAHATSDFLAYESITRDTTGMPNVLISRNGATGEAAAHGDGFYTKIGTKGFGGSGLTIRFKPDIKAIEGVDFNYVPGAQFVVFQNRSAFRVIPESLNLTPAQYLEVLLTTDSSNRGWIEKLRRQIQNRVELEGFSAEDRSRINKLLTDAVSSLTAPEGFNHPLIEVVFSSPRWQREFPKFTEDLRAQLREVIQLAVKLKRTDALEELAQNVFSQPHAVQWRQELGLLIRAAIKLKDPITLSNLARHSFSKPYAGQWREGLGLVIQAAVELKDTHALEELAQNVFSQPHAVHWREELGLVIRAAIKLKEPVTFRNLAIFTFSQPHAIQWREELGLVIQEAAKLKDMNTFSGLAALTLSRPHAALWVDEAAEALRLGIELNDQRVRDKILEISHVGPRWDKLRAIADKWRWGDSKPARQALETEFPRPTRKLKADCAAEFGRVAP